jgi:hypothetical protein
MRSVHNAQVDKQMPMPSLHMEPVIDRQTQFLQNHTARFICKSTAAKWPRIINSIMSCVSLKCRRGWSGTPLQFTLTNPVLAASQKWGRYMKIRRNDDLRTGPALSSQSQERRDNMGDNREERDTQRGRGGGGGPKGGGTRGAQPGKREKQQQRLKWVGN